jgi:cytoskeletal protein CcmA (bactofilin family)
MTTYQSGDDEAARTMPAAAPASSASQAGAASGGTVLPPGTVLEGTLRAREPVRIAGTLEGTLEADGAVVVESGGRLLARVVASELSVAGLLDGQLQCGGCLAVGASGLVKGTMQVGTLRIEDGALLDGQIQMQGARVTASLEPNADQALSAEPSPRAHSRGASDAPRGVRSALPGEAPIP